MVASPRHGGQESGGYLRQEVAPATSTTTRHKHAFVSAPTGGECRQGVQATYLPSGRWPKRSSSSTTGTYMHPEAEDDGQPLDPSREVAREDPHLLSPMLSTAAVAIMISSTKLVAHRAILGVATMVRERDFVNNKAQRIISPARRVVVEAHRTCGSCTQRA